MRLVQKRGTVFLLKFCNPLFPAQHDNVLVVEGNGQVLRIWHRQDFKVAQLFLYLVGNLHLLRRARVLELGDVYLVNNLRLIQRVRIA